MLIVALVLAVIGLTALVTAVVTSNEVVAWVCIGASALGVILLVVDAIRERQTRRTGYLPAAAESTEFTEYADGRTDEAGETEVLEPVVEGSEAPDEAPDEAADETPDEDLSEFAEEIAEEAHPDEVVHDEPEFDTYSDDEAEYPRSAEEAAVHIVDESDLDPEKTDER